MIRGIRYCAGMDIWQVEDAGIGLVEYVFGRELEGENQQAGILLTTGWITGLSISFTDVEDGKFPEALDRASGLNASYLVIETAGARGGMDICRILMDYLEKIKLAGVKIYIENGYSRKNDSLYDQITGNAYSEASFLAGIVDRLNRETGTGCFGICLNTGHGNLLRRNLCGMIEYLGRRIGLVHATDHDGNSSQYQMPYTFTKGRGELTTDWYGIIGALAMTGFKGAVVYDITGLLEVSPACLHPGWYRLLSSVALEWENILELEVFLKETLQVDFNEAGKRRGPVLFGAGRMFLNYMDVWGDAYPPSFIVDNNEKLWGSMLRGICIRPPSALLGCKGHPPLVLICNMYHVSIEKQLKAMGIRWRRYDDKYFFRYQDFGRKQGADVC